MSDKLLTEHHLKFLSFRGGCTGSSESTLVKIPHCWKSHVAAQIIVATKVELSCPTLLHMTDTLSLNIKDKCSIYLVPIIRIN